MAYPDAIIRIEDKMQSYTWRDCQQTWYCKLKLDIPIQYCLCLQDFILKQSDSEYLLNTTKGKKKPWALFWVGCTFKKKKSPLSFFFFVRWIPGNGEERSERMRNFFWQPCWLPQAHQSCAFVHSAMIYVVNTSFPSSLLMCHLLKEGYPDHPILYF